MTLLDTQISKLDGIWRNKNELMKSYFRNNLEELGANKDEIDSEVEDMIISPFKTKIISNVPMDKSNELRERAQFITKYLAKDIVKFVEGYLIEKKEMQNAQLKEQIQSTQSEIESPNENQKGNEYIQLLESLLGLEYKSKALFNEMQLVVASTANDDPNKINSEIYDIISSLKGLRRFDSSVNNFAKELYDFFNGDKTHVNKINKILNIRSVEELNEYIYEYNQSVSRTSERKYDDSKRSFDEEAIRSPRLTETLLNAKLMEFKDFVGDPPIIYSYHFGYNKAFLMNIQGAITSVKDLDEVKGNDKLMKDIQAILKTDDFDDKALQKLEIDVDNLKNTILDSTLLSDNSNLKEAIKELDSILENRIVFKEIINFIDLNTIDLQSDTSIDLQSDTSIDGQQQDNSVRLEKLREKVNNISYKIGDKVGYERENKEFQKFILYEYLVKEGGERELFLDIDQLKQVEEGLLGNMLHKIKVYLLNKTFLLDDLEIDDKELDVLFSAKEIIKARDDENQLKNILRQDGDKFTQGLKFIKESNETMYESIRSKAPQRIIEKIETEIKPLNCIPLSLAEKGCCRIM